MRQILLLFLLTGAIITTGCDDVTIADKAKMDKCTAGVVLTQAEYAQLKHDADLGKSVGRYQTHREGYRTWRLDTSTGAICLLLAPDYDWKHDAKDQINCANVPEDRK